ncbi:MAG TPA: hypothetical protein VFB26_08785, partial [Gaiellaceae bacterium]|nr:hypothetical protein [Gaiellaceae bacterium]
MNEALPRLAVYACRLGASAAVLREALALRDDLLARVDRLAAYAVAAYAVDTADPAGAARFGRSQTIRARAAAASASVEPELLAIGRETVDGWLAEDPGLAVYRGGGGRGGLSARPPAPSSSTAASRRRSRRGRGATAPASRRRSPAPT